MSPIIGARGGLSASAYGLFTAQALPNSYESIQTVTVGSTPATEILFNSIPQTYKHLQVRALVRNNRAAFASNTYFRFNGDTGNNYAFHAMYGTGSTTGAYGGTSANVMLATDPSGSFTSNSFAGQIYDILDYTNTNKNKTVKIVLGFDGNGSGEIHIASDLWMNTSAISSIRFFPNSGEYVQYTQFALYGIKG
jgi:hypothetical protein